MNAFWQKTFSQFSVSMIKSDSYALLMSLIIYSHFLGTFLGLFIPSLKLI